MAYVTEEKIRNTQRVLAEDMKLYVEAILKEYGDFIPQERKHFLQGITNFENNIIIKESGTISMFANPEGVIMPLGAYKVFNFIRKIPGYGINKKHQSYKDGKIVNQNTYYDYLKHVLISGMSVEDFFRDTLLHETMHFCGSGGRSLLREGFTELKTRQLADKYGLKASRSGYPKEVEIANELQQILGSKIADQITFAKGSKEIDEILTNRFGSQARDLFAEIELMMNESANKVYDHSKFGGIFGPIKKARAYSKIDYSEVYKKIDEFREVVENRKKDFSKEIEVELGEKNQTMNVYNLDKDFEDIIPYLIEKGFRTYASCDGVLAHHTPRNLPLTAFISFLHSEQIDKLLAACYDKKDLFTVCMSTQHKKDPYELYDNEISGNHYTIYFKNFRGERTEEFKEFLHETIENREPVDENKLAFIKRLMAAMEESQRPTDEKQDVSDTSFEIELNGKYHIVNEEKTDKMNYVKATTKLGHGYYRNMQGAAEAIAEKYGLPIIDEQECSETDEVEYVQVAINGTEVAVFLKDENVEKIPEIMDLVHSIENELEVVEVKELSEGELEELYAEFDAEFDAILEQMER